MGSIRKIAASTTLGIAGIAVVAAVLGCGSSTTNNDQGASFSALGFFSAATPEPPPGLSGFVTTLSTDSASNGFATDSRAFIGLENRLRNSFLRVTKVDCDYNVPGASIPIPSDSFAISAFLNASPNIGGPQIGGSGGSGGVGGAGGATGGTGGASGGTGGSGGASGGGVSGGAATGQGTRTYAEFLTISPQIYGFLNANRNALPELPFQMQAFCTATAISNAGDVYESNPVAITAQFVPESFVDADGGTGGTGTGGDLDGFDGDDSANSGDDTTTVGSGSSTVLAPEGEVIPVD